MATFTESKRVWTSDEEMAALEMLARKARRNGPITISEMTDAELREFMDFDLATIRRRGMYGF